MEKEFHLLIRRTLFLLLTLLLALPVTLTPRTKALHPKLGVVEISQRREKKIKGIRPKRSFSHWMNLEDFEKRDKKNTFSAWKGKNLLLKTSRIESGPNPNSKRSLYVSIRRGRVQKFKIRPPKPLFIKGFVQKFSLYTKTLSGRVRIFMDIEDQNKNRFIVRLGSLSSNSLLGSGAWKKLIVKLPTQIKQRSLQPTIAAKHFPKNLLKNLKEDTHTQKEKKESPLEAGITLHGLLLYLDSPSVSFFVDDLSVQVRPYAKSFPLDFGMSLRYLE